MSNTTSHGGRVARLIDDSGEAWYHVYNRVACDKDAMPLSEKPEAREAFIRYLNFYASAYSCEVATYTVMGNHYHLIMKMAPYEKLSQEELAKHIVDFYPNTHQQTALWTDAHWEQFNRRLFSLPDLMRNIQQGFARWYNKTYARRGRFWADRFKSTLLYGEDALLECMQYVDLNPVRAGLVARPEDYAYGAFALREKGDPEQLLDLRHLLSEKTEVEAYSSYKSKVYARGSVQSKGCDAVISDQLVEEECLSKFDLGSGAEARDHLRFFVDGLVIGAKDKVQEWLLHMQNRGTYRRRKNPIALPKQSPWFALREQRSHFEGG